MIGQIGCIGHDCLDCHSNRIELEQLRAQNTSLDAECARLEALNAELAEALRSFTRSDYIKAQHPQRYAKAVKALAKVEASNGS